LGWVADSCGHFGVCTIGVLMSGAVMLLLGLPIWEQVSGATGVAIETGNQALHTIPSSCTTIPTTHL
jgi:hypothetical protein